MSRLVIGYGNPLREDDGFGPRVAEEIAKRRPTWRVLTTQQLTLDFVLELKDAERVAFIDASLGSPAGALRIVPLTGTTTSDVHDFSSHHVPPERLLYVTRELYGRVPLAFLVTVYLERTGFGTELSPAVAESIPEAIRRCIAMLEMDIQHVSECGMLS